MKTIIALFLLLTTVYTEANAFVYNHKASFYHVSSNPVASYDQALQEQMESIFSALGNNIIIHRVSDIQITEVPLITVDFGIYARADFEITINDPPSVFANNAAKEFIKNEFSIGNDVYTDIVLRHQKEAYKFLINDMTSINAKTATGSLLTQFTIHRPEILDALTDAFIRKVHLPQIAVVHLSNVGYMLRDGVPASSKSDDVILYSLSQSPLYAGSAAGYFEYLTGNKSDLVDELLYGIMIHTNEYFQPHEGLTLSMNWYEKIIDRFPPTESARNKILSQLPSVQHPTIQKLYDYALKK